VNNYKLDFTAVYCKDNHMRRNYLPLLNSELFHFDNILSHELWALSI